jgi:hypothetical protein
MSFAFIVWIIIAVACRTIAQYKGRRTWVWTGLGILGGLFALIAIICLPNVKKQSNTNI